MWPATRLKQQCVHWICLNMEVKFNCSLIKTFCIIYNHIYASNDSHQVCKPIPQAHPVLAYCRLLFPHHSPGGCTVHLYIVWNPQCTEPYWFSSLYLCAISTQERGRRKLRISSLQAAKFVNLGPVMVYWLFMNGKCEKFYLL